MNRTASGSEDLSSFLDDTFDTLDTVLSEQQAELRQREVGMVTYVGHGIARVTGLPNVKSEEIIRFPGNLFGLVFNIDPDKMASYVEALSAVDEYQDIVKLEASTGAIYLYSSQYLNGDLAKSLMEWEEVGQYENP